MARNRIGWTRTQPKRDNSFEHSLRSIQPLPAQLLPDTLRSYESDRFPRRQLRSRIATILDTQECLIVLRLRTHDTMFRRDDNNLLKEFRCAFVEHTTDTFTHMHILLSSVTSRVIFSHNTQLSRCPNFGLNSRKTLHRDGKLIERTVNTFPSAAVALPHTPKSV